MSNVVLKAEELAKRYEIGSSERYRALRDVVANVFTRPFRPKKAEDSPTSFWALKGVSFELERGEVLGIVGHNGAGKSTLLKILSRITAPTSGYAEVRGRVGSLLEVGTGFHPELTGRENTYLNGAILGMRRAEIRRKFDEIVEFAGVAKFIDTPVKHYSSGMYVRLAFAVGVHLEPEVLVIDEVLAVGDAEFQRRCFDRMREIGKGGRTILLVSHNMAAVRSICTRAIALESGRVVHSGEVNHVVDQYLARLTVPRDGQLIETPSFDVLDVSIQSRNGPVIKTFDPLEIRVTVKARCDIEDPGLYAGLLTIENARLAGLDFKDFTTAKPVKKGETVTLGFVIESLPFLQGNYQIELHVKDMASHKIELVPALFPFEVVETPVYGGRKLDNWFGQVGLRARAEVFESAGAV